jgi:hypothetical protein
MVKQKKSRKLIKVLDETIKISKKKRNGILKFLVSTDEKSNLVRYSLTYINTNICNEDNGRVLGYDNDHGYHHRHYMGVEEKVDFVSFEDIKNRFEIEWREIHDKNQK